MALPGILQQIARANPMMEQIKNMMSMVKMAQNPSAMINHLMQTNPQLKQVIDIVNNQYDGDPDKAFRTIAEKNGINPDDIYKLMR